jgi:cytochrome d ubiquinol oxidase subunit II
LQGITVDGRAYAGGCWEWLSPFSILTGHGLVTGCSLLGACWLVWKTEQGLQRQARTYAGRFGIMLLAMIGVISLMTLTLEAQYYHRWLSYPGIVVTALVPFATIIATLLFYRSLRLGRDAQPFFWALSLFGLCLVGLGISIWPDVIPARVSIWQAAAPELSQIFMLVGAAIKVPIILAYTAWSYWVFRGKVGAKGYY